MPILNQSPEQPIQELTTSEETASSVTPWGVMTIPDPVEAELQVTTERVDAPSLVHVEVPVSPQAEEVATPEPMPSEVTPVAEIAPVEIQQEIVVSTDNSETVVTSSETSEVAAPIAETFTIEQKTLDAPAAETTPVPTEAPVEVAVPIQSEPTDIHTTLAEPAATESQPPVVEEQQTTVVESTPPVEKEVAPAVGEPPAQAFDFVEQVTEQQEPVQEVNVSETTTFEPSPIVSDIQEPEATTIEPAHVESAPSDHTEIREVQSQLAEISAVAETGETTFTTAASPLVVELDRGFRFTSTEFCARSGLEFIEDLEKVDPAIVEHHCRNGDFERWFKDVLADEFAVESIKSIRESNLSGSEMRTQLVAVIAPHFRK